MTACIYGRDFTMLLSNLVSQSFLSHLPESSDNFGPCWFFQIHPAEKHLPLAPISVPVILFNGLQDTGRNPKTHPQVEPVCHLMQLAYYILQVHSLFYIVSELSSCNLHSVSHTSIVTFHELVVWLICCYIYMVNSL